MKRSLVLTAFFSLCVVSNAARAAPSVNSFMKGFVDEIRTTLEAGDAEHANELFAEHFEMERFGRRCLIDHWDEFTAAERDRYVDLLDRNIRKRLKEKMLFTKDDTDFVLSPKRIASLPERLIQVQNRLRIRRGDLELTLTLCREGRNYRIVDYELEGALLSRNYRGHFNYLIRRYGKDGFFDRLERKLQSP